VETVTFCTEIYASTLSVNLKYHPCALAALHSEELCHTLTVYEKDSSTVVHNQSILESVSHCVVYRTTTNVYCFEDWRPHQPPLLEATVEITDDAKCKDSYCGSFTESMVCAGNLSGFRGPCYLR
jgi:hypothetical protein